MPRWLEIALTLVLFAFGMAVLSWALHATVPNTVDWVADRIGDVAMLVIVAAVFMTTGFFAWRGHRPRKGSAGRLEGR